MMRRSPVRLMPIAALALVVAGCSAPKKPRTGTVPAASIPVVSDPAPAQAAAPGAAPAACPPCPARPGEAMAPRAEKAAAPKESILFHLVDQYEPVRFSHELHVEAEPRCESCHHHASGVETAPPCRACHGLATEDLRRPGLKGAYHRQCMNCHREMGAGPLGCEDCHKRKKDRGPVATKDTLAFVPDKMTLGHLSAEFEPSLFDHKAHVDHAGKCEDCHHESSRVEKTPACRKCHNTPEKLKAAYHDQCMTCHRPVTKHTAQKIESLRKELDAARAANDDAKVAKLKAELEAESTRKGSPLNCSDCHRPKHAPGTVKLDSIVKKAGRVPFNHADHADAVDLCTDCHHADTGYSKLQACRKCHGETADSGSAKGLSLEDAYHGQCIACHEKEGSGPTKCAECHSLTR